MILGSLHTLGAASRRVAAEFPVPGIVELDSIVELQPPLVQLGDQFRRWTVYCTASNPTALAPATWPAISST